MLTSSLSFVGSEIGKEDTDFFLFLVFKRICFLRAWICISLISVAEDILILDISADIYN